MVRSEQSSNTRVDTRTVSHDVYNDDEADDFEEEFVYHALSHQ